MPSPKRFDIETFLVRFLCGFILGGLVSGFGLMEVFWLAFFVGGIILGLLHWLLADPFWHFFANWMR